MSGTSGPPRDRPLIIGVGNELRGDDGNGPRLANWAAEKFAGQVAVLTVPALFPELAEALAAAEAVLFLDAAVGGSTPRLEPLTPAESVRTLGHGLSPSELLALTAAVFGARPPTAILLLPGADFGFADSACREADSAGDAARELLAEWVANSAK